MSFDVTRAVAGLNGEKLAGLSLVLMPYSLLSTPKKDAAISNNREMLKASGIEFLKMELK